MKLTPGERKLLDVLDRLVGNAMPFEWLKPAQRSLVKRMRVRGLISKRNPGWVTLTQIGKKARP
ncbi:hypothetical protein IVA94_14620 [Bradyrhizobium sp. 156]|uniref:hypothetical protein n=1 Tax=Bradyrhizobium sp. 156 TaxID=2782630 RepID=UPI001FF99B5F|nr:hypothetical protein [Bradyrhizobium sp. 156]MCK1322102.1 hypothetical protein [Bradyrhizobium sp. 156]